MGNMWVEVEDPRTLSGSAMTAPGDNNFAVDKDDGPFLVYRLPVPVKPGEATEDGKTWQVWFRMRVPTDRNSFYWQLGTDGENWNPTPNSNANRANDDGRNGSNVWYWQDQLTGNTGALDPELAVGVNWLRVGCREADVLPNAPLFDVVCLKNYGPLGSRGAPEDDEVLTLLQDICQAKIVAQPATGTVPFEVRFDGRGSTTAGGTITSFKWTFGDGRSATGPEVTHLYTDAGLFRARLTVTDNQQVSCSASVAITARCATAGLSPWTSTDVGAPVFPGCARIEGQCLSGQAGGNGITRAEDSFYFVHQAKSGDASITAQLKEVVSWQAQARAGVMLRSTTAPDSPFAMIAMNPLGGETRAVFLSRRAPGQNVSTRSSAQGGGAVVLDPPRCWLRLERKGAEFIGSTSADGAAWTEFHRVTLDAPPEQMLAGLALVAADRSDTGLSAEVVFCNIGLSPSSGKVFHRGDSNADGSLNLTDGVYIFNFLFLAGPQPSCREAADPNNDGTVNITDGIYLMNFLFLGGPPPAAPGPLPAPCGPDPDPPGSAGDIGCGSYNPC
jgi:hypothetical protein